MAQVLQLAIELQTVDCGVCGGSYAINKRHHTWCHENGKAWTCPYCKCSWGYAGIGEVDKLKNELEAERARKQAALERANRVEADLLKAQRAEKRMKTRIAAGTCPCCQRTFKQLAAHMHRKHPDYQDK